MDLTNAPKRTTSYSRHCLHPETTANTLDLFDKCYLAFPENRR